MGAKEAGAAFLAGVLERLPESHRAQAKAIFEAAEAESAISAIGDGVLARSDYSKQMDAIRAQEQTLASKQAEFEALHASNVAWLNEHQAAVTDYLTIKPQYDALIAASGTPTGTGTTTVAAPQGGKEAEMTKDEIAKLVAEQISTAAGDVVGISAWAAERSIQHFQQFGEKLPVNELVQATIAARQKGDPITLDGMYQQKYGEQLAAKAKEAEDARINTEVEKRLAEQLRERQGAGLPFPTRAEASPLDLLHKPPDPATYGVDAAVAEYTRLVNAKPGAAA